MVSSDKNAIMQTKKHMETMPGVKPLQPLMTHKTCPNAVIHSHNTTISNTTKLEQTYRLECLFQNEYNQIQF